MWHVLHPISQFPDPRNVDQKASLLLVFQQRMSSDISPSLVNWMTSMMTMRLQVILEHMPITQEQIQAYIVHTEVKDLSGAQASINVARVPLPLAGLISCVGSSRVSKLPKYIVAARWKTGISSFSLSFSLSIFKSKKKPYKGRPKTV